MTIHGHNIKNGTMFHALLECRDKAFCEAHPIIEFETARGLKQYSVCAVAQIEPSDAWYQFVDACDAEDYLDQLAAISRSAVYTSAELPQYGSQILTPSTCFGVNNAERLLVIAVEIPTRP